MRQPQFFCQHEALSHPVVTQTYASVKWQQFLLNAYLGVFMILLCRAAIWRAAVLLCSDIFRDPSFWMSVEVSGLWGRSICPPSTIVFANFLINQCSMSRLIIEFHQSKLPICPTLSCQLAKRAQVTSIMNLPKCTCEEKSDPADGVWKYHRRKVKDTKNRDAKMHSLPNVGVVFFSASCQIDKRNS